MDEPGAHAGDLVRGNGRADPAAAKRLAPLDLPRGDGSGQWHDEVRVVILQVELVRAEVHDVVLRGAQRRPDPPL